MNPISSSSTETKRYWAAVQLDAGPEPEDNLDRAIDIIEDASDRASLVALPEFFLVRGNHETVLANAISMDSGPVERLSRTARENNVNLLAGSMPFEDPDRDDRCFNRSLLFGADGNLLARYDKIHLFDVDIQDDITVRESDVLRPGGEAQTVEIDGLSAGMSICYDLRFSALYERYADEGVEALFVPSNFTRETGRAHWIPLLRARAIQNQSYVIAPNQIGSNEETGVASLGQSCIIDPWGKVVACRSDSEGWIEAEIDLEYLRQIRRELPSLSHRSQTPDEL